MQMRLLFVAGETKSSFVTCESSGDAEEEANAAQVDSCGPNEEEERLLLCSVWLVVNWQTEEGRKEGFIEVASVKGAVDVIMSCHEIGGKRGWLQVPRYFVASSESTSDDHERPKATTRKNEGTPPRRKSGGRLLEPSVVVAPMDVPPMSNFYACFEDVAMVRVVRPETPARQRRSEEESARVAQEEERRRRVEDWVASIAEEDFDYSFSDFERMEESFRRLTMKEEAEEEELSPRDDVASTMKVTVEEINPHPLARLPEEVDLIQFDSDLEPQPETAVPPNSSEVVEAPKAPAAPEAPGAPEGGVKREDDGGDGGGRKSGESEAERWKEALVGKTLAVGTGASWEDAFVGMGEEEREEHEAFLRARRRLPRPRFRKVRKHVNWDAVMYDDHLPPTPDKEED